MPEEAPRSMGALGIGIDVGTQGARVVVADRNGNVRARASESWPLQTNPSDFREQNPLVWWHAIVSCVNSAINLLNSAGADSIKAISVAATSGTLVLADTDLAPVRPAIMWNDKRARRESDLANLAFDQRPAEGYAAKVLPSFTLAKALWVRSHESETWSKTRHVLSAGDWILAKLTGDNPVSDYTNALKTGFDVEYLEWPIAIDDLGITHDLLPRVVAPGTYIGTLTRKAADEFGLRNRPDIIAGMTDANAAQIAGGAVYEGDWLTTIGTGLSVKGVSGERLSDKSGALYSHRSWHRGWIPTATSHCGADSISRRFAGDDLNELTLSAATRSLSSVLVLPLATVGEFFPFWAPHATGFEHGTATDVGDLFRGYLEGVGFVERLIMDRMNALGAIVAGKQITMGGGAANELWMQLRASILGWPVSRPVETSSAFGAAAIALAGAPENLDGVVASMVRQELVVDPEPAAVCRYEQRLREWTAELDRRGYLADTPIGARHV